MAPGNKRKDIILYLSLISLAAYFSLQIIEVKISPVLLSLLIIFPSAVAVFYISQNLIRNNLKSYLLLLCLVFAGLNIVYLLYGAATPGQKYGAVITLLSFILSSVSIGLSITNEGKS